MLRFASDIIARELKISVGPVRIGKAGCYKVTAETPGKLYDRYNKTPPASPEE
ncbi:unnamed protein product [marine sediment metagenome]|uniref:Uncharacterized protein n=1 Tax=marine sediment metagenome TaxID=412755 RepID=X1M0G4_9ZZZZ